MDRDRLAPITQGAAGRWTITLRGATGAALTGVYAGTETFSARLWPGDDLPVEFNPTAAWLVAADGTVTLSVSSAQSASVDAGEYSVDLLITDGGSDYVCYRGVLEILQAPGTGVAPATYCSRDDVMRYGRHVLSESPASYDQSGWAEQRGRARSWFEDCLHAHDRGRVETGLGWGTRSRVAGSSKLRSPWLVDALAADQLLVTDAVRECNAYYALSLILAARPDEAAGFRSAAHESAKLIVAEIDTNADGAGEYAIDLTVAGW